MPTDVTFSNAGVTPAGTLTVPGTGGRDTTIDDLATDAGAALDFLRAQPEVRAGAVGLFGHSEGGWVAAGRDDVPWVITNSCPRHDPRRSGTSRVAARRRRHPGRLRPPLRGGTT